MAENENKEQIDFMSQLEIQLSIAGVPDVAAALQQIIMYEQGALSNISALKAQYGGLNGAINQLIQSHDKREAASSKATKNASRDAKSLSSDYKGLSITIEKAGYSLASSISRIATPTAFVSALKATLDYNKSLLSVSASVNRLGISGAFLEKSLTRISLQTALTRKETVALFDKYQESMRFVSLQQFEGILKRVQSMVGANSQEMDKYQSALASVSQEYPSLARGLANLEKAGAGVGNAEKAALQQRISSLYFVGKIKDAEYKRLTAYISGNQQIIGADRERQRNQQEQIAAANLLKRQFESIGISVGQALLPHLQSISGFLEKTNSLTDNWKLNLVKILGIFAGIKVGAMAVTAGFGLLSKGVAKGGKKILFGGGQSVIPGMTKNGGGLLSKAGGVLSKRGGVVGKLGSLLSGAGKVTATVAGSGGLSQMGQISPVFVTNWPASLGSQETLLSAQGGYGKQLQSLMGKGGPLGKSGGFLGKAGEVLTGGSKLAKLGKGVGIGAILGIGGWATKKLGGKLEQEGSKGLGGAVSVAGGGLSAGSLAATGAAIGSFILPGIGTAVGGALGAGLGIFNEWDGLAEGFDKIYGAITGREEKEAKEAAKNKKYTAEMQSKIDDFKSKAIEESDFQDRILKAQKDDEASMGDIGLANLFGNISGDVSKAKESLAAEREKVDAIIADEFNKTGFAKVDVTLKGDELSKNISEAISAQKSEVEEIQRIIDTKSDVYKQAEDGGDQRKADQEALEASQDKLEILNRIVETQEEDNESLKKATQELTKHESRLQSVNTLISKQQDLASQISGLYKSQVGNIDALIKKMSITGQIDIGSVFDGVENAQQTLDAEIKAQQKLVDILNMKNSVQAANAAEEEAGKKGITKENKAMFEELRDLRMAGLDQVEVSRMQEDAEARINSLVEDRTALLAKVGEAYAETLKLTQTQAQKSTLLVQLADNYAIGVGASVQMRMQEINSQGEIISVLKERLKAERESYRRSVETGESKSQNITLLNKTRETENEILQAQIKQASTARSMRDAWVQAISAQNTGMDGFSEIIMNAEQNTAQIQMLDGAVRSSASGAIALRDNLGRVVEDVGFAGSEQMNTRGDIVARGGRKLSDMAYNTGRSYDQNTGRSVEQALRGDLRSAVGDMISATEYAKGGNFEALAAAGHKFTLSAEAGQDSFRKAIEDSSEMAGKNISDAGEDIKDGGKKAAKSIGDAGGGSGRGGAGDGSGFSMGGGITSTYIGPPVKQDNEKWTEALEKAPKDTLPRLIVNENSKAVPVFVVNLKEIENMPSGSPTSKDVEDAQKTERLEREKGRTTVDVIKEKEKDISTLITGSIAVGELVDRGQKIKISDALDMKDLSKEGKEFLKHMQRAGRVYIDQADLEEEVADMNSYVSGLKEAAIKKEFSLIERKNKEIAKLKKMSVAQEATGTVPLDIAQQIDEANSHKNKALERIKDIQTGEVAHILSNMDISPQDTTSPFRDIDTGKTKRSAQVIFDAVDIPEVVTNRQTIIDSVSKKNAPELNINNSDLSSSYENIISDLGKATLSSSDAFNNIVDDTVLFVDTYNKRVDSFGKRRGVSVKRVSEIKDISIDIIQDTIGELQSIYSEGIPSDLIAKNIPSVINLIATGRDVSDERFVDVVVRGPKSVEYKAKLQEQPEILLKLKEKLEVIMAEEDFSMPEISVVGRSMNMILGQDDIVVKDSLQASILFEMNKIEVPIEGVSVAVKGLKEIYAQASSADVKIETTPTLVFDNLSKHYLDSDIDIDMPTQKVKAMVDEMASSIGVKDNLGKSILASSLIGLRENILDKTNEMGMSLADFSKGVDRMNWGAVGENKKAYGVIQPPVEIENQNLESVMEDTFRNVTLPQDKMEDFKNVFIDSASGILKTLSGQIGAGLDPQAAVSLSKKIPQLFTDSERILELPEDERGKEISAVSSDLSRSLNLRGVDIEASDVESLLLSINKSLEAPIESLKMMDTRIDEYSKGVESIVTRNLRGINANNVDIIGESGDYLINFSEVTSIIEDSISRLQKDLGNSVDLSGVNPERIFDGLSRINDEYLEMSSSARASEVLSSKSKSQETSSSIEKSVKYGNGVIGNILDNWNNLLNIESVFKFGSTETKEPMYGPAIAPNKSKVKDSGKSNALGSIGGQSMSSSSVFSDLLSLFGFSDRDALGEEIEIPKADMEKVKEMGISLSIPSNIDDVKRSYDESKAVNDKNREKLNSILKNYQDQINKKQEEQKSIEKILYGDFAAQEGLSSSDVSKLPGDKQGLISLRTKLGTYDKGTHDKVLESGRKKYEKIIKESEEAKNKAREQMSEGQLVDTETRTGAMGEAQTVVVKRYASDEKIKEFDDKISKMTSDPSYILVQAFDKYKESESVGREDAYKDYQLALNRAKQSVIDAVGPAGSVKFGATDESNLIQSGRELQKQAQILDREKETLNTERKNKLQSVLDAQDAAKEKSLQQDDIVYREMFDSIRDIGGGTIAGVEQKRESLNTDQASLIRNIVNTQQELNTIDKLDKKAEEAMSSAKVVDSAYQAINQLIKAQFDAIHNVSISESNIQEDFGLSMPKVDSGVNVDYMKDKYGGKLADIEKERDIIHSSIGAYDAVQKEISVRSNEIVKMISDVKTYPFGTVGRTEQQKELEKYQEMTDHLNKKKEIANQLYEELSAKAESVSSEMGTVLSKAAEADKRGVVIEEVSQSQIADRKSQGIMEVGSFGSLKDSKKEVRSYQMFSRKQQMKEMRGLNYYKNQYGDNSPEYQSKQKEYVDKYKKRNSEMRAIKEYEKVSGESVAVTMSQTGMNMNDIMDGLKAYGVEGASEEFAKREASLTKGVDPIKMLGDYRHTVSEDMKRQPYEGIPSSAVGGADIPKGELSKVADVPIGPKAQDIGPSMTSGGNSGDGWAKALLSKDYLSGYLSPELADVQTGSKAPGMESPLTGSDTRMTESFPTISDNTTNTAVVNLSGITLHFDTIEGLSELPGKLTAAINSYLAGERENIAATVVGEATGGYTVPTQNGP